MVGSEGGGSGRVADALTKALATAGGLLPCRCNIRGGSTAAR